MFAAIAPAASGRDPPRLVFAQQLGRRPPPRYRLSVSTCAAKVRASLLKARSALSCCGIITAARFFDPGKNRNRPAAEIFDFRP
jgi:hypothetical protein